MSNPAPEELLKLVLISSYSDIKYYEGLIKEWDDPKDIAQRAAQIILKIHRLYGRMAFATLQKLHNNCKHPKKMRDLCADGTIYCMNCNSDLTEDQIMSVRTPTLIKQKVLSRRKLVKKYAKQKMKQLTIAKKLDVSLSTIEKDMLSLRNA